MTSARRIVQSSRLLALPAELRNLIYGYVLATSKPLLCVRYMTAQDDRYKYYKNRISVELSGDEAGSNCKELYTEINQIQYACQLLRRETSFLMSTTHVVFPEEPCPLESASTTCNRWLHGRSAAQISKLQTIIIRERVPCSIPDYSSTVWSTIFDLQAIAHLAIFCRAHTHIRVQVYMARFDKRLKNFCRRSLIGCIVSMAVRKESCCAGFQCTSGEAGVVEEAVRKMSGVWQGYARDALRLPENLRFFPAGRFERGEWPGEGSRPGLRAGVEEWYQVGI